jgi:hypothetical protein
MKNLKMYLDTSIINFLRADDAPVYKNATEILFNDIIVPNRINTYISRVLLEKTDKITFLAGEYIKEKIIPEKKISDAFHVAYSTIFEMDILLSWNFKHLANVDKEQRILIVNKTHGYNYPFRLANPLEVQYDE